MEKLKRSTVPAEALILATPQELGIVHIGLGNFHRAHLAVHTAEAVAQTGGDWGIYAHSLRSKKIAEEMAAQDFLYTVVDIHPDSEKTIIPGIHVGASGGPDSLKEVLIRLTDSRTKIISLTITESGYCYSTQTGGLDETRPEIQLDLEDLSTPRSVIGLLAQALITRAQTHGSPVTILSCDNLTSNGSTTRKVLLEFANKLTDSDSRMLVSYINTKISFPNSMVDRIVPSTEESHRELVVRRLGIRDEIPVPAEKFSMWVMEDDFIAGRPQWEHAGVLFSNDVQSFETMKLRLLNGSHSLLAYVGALAGKERVPDSRFTPFIESAVRKFMKEEMLPTFSMPLSIEFDQYVNDLFSRWSNTVLSDKIARIGSDGSIKLPPRITATSLWHGERNSKTPLTALILASWLACVAPPTGFDSGPIARAMKDPASEYLSSLSSQGESASRIVEKLFGDARIFSNELNKLTNLKWLTTKYLEEMINNGVESATQLAMNEK